MIIDEINERDLDILEALGNECLPIYYKSKNILDLYSDEKYQLFKVSIDNKIIGFCFLKKHLERNHIMSLCIKPEYQKRGVGSKIIRFLKEKYDKPISLYVQSSNVSAVNFYVKNNFKIVKTIPEYYSVLENKEAYYMIL